MANKQINPNLRKLAELTHNPNLELPDLEKQIKEQVPVQTNQLGRDTQGKPIIKLMPLEKTAVSAPTQEVYNTLMQVYECGGWRWNFKTSSNPKPRWLDEGLYITGVMIFLPIELRNLVTHMKGAENFIHQKDIKSSQLKNSTTNKTLLII